MFVGGCRLLCQGKGQAHKQVDQIMLSTSQRSDHSQEGVEDQNRTQRARQRLAIPPVAVIVRQGGRESPVYEGLSVENFRKLFGLILAVPGRAAESTKGSGFASAALSFLLLLRGTKPY
jgi:hypothetical protein